MNRIVEVKLTLADGDGGDWIVDVTKEFAPENGGGSERLREYGGRDLHHALDVARGMVTLSPGRRSDGGNSDGK